jgi:ribosomal protein L12E/L44/L45/RPP1/RPP2
MPSLTRRGARSVTADLDRIANLFQNRFADLGIPEKIANDFSLRCDLLSDHIERYAIKLAEEQQEEDEAEEGQDKKAKKGEDEDEEAVAEEGQEKKAKKGEDKDEDEAKSDKPWEAKKAAKKGEDEEEESPNEKETAKVAGKKSEEDEEPAEEESKAGSKKKATRKSVKSAGFDANDIGEPVPGPDEILPPIEAFMKGHFTQKWFEELSGLQEAGKLGMSVNASVARLRRLANLSRLSDMCDILSFILAKIGASDLGEVKGLSADIKRMHDAAMKVKGMQIEQAATGGVTPEVMVACDKLCQAIGEVLPHLQQVIAGVDTASPTALLEFQNMVGGGSLKELVGIAASIATDAAKGASPKAAEAKKEAGKKSEDEPKEEEDEEQGKQASRSFGYDLFV